jgi:hypothetical protein
MILMNAMSVSKEANDKIDKKYDFTYCRKNPKSFIPFMLTVISEGAHEAVNQT